MKKEDYKVPSLKVVPVRHINLLAASPNNVIRDNGDGTTSGETNENEDYNGLFD